MFASLRSIEINITVELRGNECTRAEIGSCKAAKESLRIRELRSGSRYSFYFCIAYLDSVIRLNQSSFRFKYSKPLVRVSHFYANSDCLLLKMAE